MSRGRRYAVPAELHSKARDGFQIVVDEATSLRMAGIRQRGTSPELIVRKLVTGLGHRYRVENRDLPGSPDLANRSKRWAIFVHGCYWHRHPGCKLATTPKRNREFWEAKFARNVERDAEAVRSLTARDFQTLLVWECETRHPERLAIRLGRWAAFSCI
jgi:DNA mismatch endonuclease (patch repair protein)